MNLKERAGQLKTDIPAVFIALKRKETPFSAKIFAGLTIVYALSPIDLIPDFVPGLGYLDDVIILPALIALAVRSIPTGIMAECREQAKSWQESGQLRGKWYYALPIVIVWALLIFLACRWIAAKTGH